MQEIDPLRSRLQAATFDSKLLRFAANLIAMSSASCVDPAVMVCSLLRQDTSQPNI